MKDKLLCEFCRKYPAKHKYIVRADTRDIDLCGRCDLWPDDRKKSAAERVILGHRSEPPRRKPCGIPEYATKVYFIQSVRGGPIKIGWAISPSKRRDDLQAAHPNRLVILATMTGGRKTEMELHQKFSQLHIRGEWFRPANNLLAFIQTINGKSVAS